MSGEIDQRAVGGEMERHQGDAEVDHAEDFNAQEESAKLPALVILLIVNLAILRPLSTAAFWTSPEKLSRMRPDIETNWEGISARINVGLSISAFIGLFCAYVLYRQRESHTIPLAVLLIWIGGPLMFHFTGWPIADVAKSAFVHGIWSAYLLRSQAVAVAYQRAI